MGWKGGKSVIGTVSEAHGLSAPPLGTRGPFEGETGSAWAPHFLFIEFVPGKSEREGWSGAV